MHDEYFDYESCDLFSDAGFQLQNCTLKKELDFFKPGEKFKLVEFDYEEGWLKIYVDPISDARYEYKLSLNIEKR